MFMKDRKMNGVQLYYNIGPLSACLMIGGGLIVDTVLQNGVSIFEVAYTPSIIVRYPARRGEESGEATNEEKSPN